MQQAFIHSGYLYIAPPRSLLRGALSPATAKAKCLKKLAKGRHNVPWQQAQRKREFIPSGWDNHRESSTLFNSRPLIAKPMYVIRSDFRKNHVI